ncbi:MAG: RsmB/NOP family class I SAM-dependent RNA methyltransferase [Desulfovibrio sp.]|nr:RsmB/NOP family class I SAM-dependent RNA methyltransferase [Desulfovibrio sp.]
MTSAPRPSRSFRLVCEENRQSEVEDLLEAEGYRFEPEPFSRWCKKLVREPAPLGSSLAAFFGYIYIQDRSSMLPPLALSPSPGSGILDMCASPGGKTGFLGQLSGAAGFVLGNDPNQSRLATLRANIAISNLLQVSTCAYPGEKLPLIPASWNYILLDPPCSGWGTEEKNPSVRRLWQGKKIDRLTAIQRALLKKASELLAPGGRLLYSTCTVNPAENEEQIAWAESSLGLIQGALAPFPGFAFAPTRAGCLLVDGKESAAQGFFLSLLLKPDGEKPARREEYFAASPLPAKAIESPVVDPSPLAKGKTAIFGQKVYYLPGPAFDILPRKFQWKGFALGKFRRTGTSEVFLPGNRLRRLANSRGPKAVFDTVGEIRDFLAGKAIPAKGDEVSLFWRDLPLGFAAIKNGRLIASFRQALSALK